MNLDEALQRVKELEEESRQWEKASLVKLLRERDQLQATVTAQQEKIRILKDTQGYNEKFSQVLAEQVEEIRRLKA